VRLTAAGELLLGYARRIAALEREAEGAVADLAGLRRGKLVVGASLTIGSYFLPAVLGRFRQLHPKIDLELEIANTQRIEQMLLDGKLDLAFTEGLPPSEGFIVRPFHHDRLVPIAPPGHPLLSKKRVTAAMLCRERLILREAGSGTREVIEAAFQKRKLTIKPAMLLGSAEAIKRAVQSEIGLAIVSELTIHAECAAGTLQVIRLSDLDIQRPFQLLRLAGRTESKAAEAFAALMG
jgi:DNA-binding transcriptional LysR family regulator